MHEARLLCSLLLPVCLCFFLFGTASTSPVSGDVEASLTDHDSVVGLWLGGVALGAIFCVVVVMLLSQCMDCYNSEVASESHPACGQSKSDYIPVNTTSFDHNSYGQSHGGHRPPAAAAPLPYSLNPAPSAPPLPPVGPGGLGAQQWGSQPMPQPTGPGGLGAQPWGSQAPPQPAPQAPRQQGRPYTGPEQPPTYFEATTNAGRV